jgi:hypothetical protein
VSNFLYPILDGIAPSWADIKVRASGDGVPLIEMGDIQSISTGTTVEVGEQREGGVLIKRTTGSVSLEASWTLYASGYQKFLRGLRAKMPVRNGQRLISLVSFNIVVQWTPPGSTEILEYRIKGCRGLGRKMDSSEGTDAQLVELPLSPMQICDVVDDEEFIWI